MSLRVSSPSSFSGDRYPSSKPRAFSWGKKGKKKSKRIMYIATLSHLQMEYNLRDTHREHGDRRAYEESASRF